MVVSLALGLACTSSGSAPDELRRTTCDRARLAAAAREIEGIATKDEDTTEIAARTLVEACEIPEIEPFIAAMWRDSPRYNWLPQRDRWFALRSYVCPVWDEVVNAGAYLPYPYRAGPLWRGCRFSRYGFYDEARFQACGMIVLPFVVFEMLRAAQVDEATASTLAGALCEHENADIVGHVLDQRGVPLAGAELRLDCKVGLVETVTTDAAGSFGFSHPDRNVCILNVNVGHTSTMVPIGRKAAERSDLKIRVDTGAP